MKKYICMIFVLFAVSLISKAETVDAVYFNPSRLGRYEMLKISDTLTAAGDIQAGSMSIQTGNKATITADSYTIETINASGSINMPNTQFIADRMSVLRGGKATFGKEDSVSSIDDLYNTEFIKTGILDAVRVGMYITGDQSISDLDGNKPLALRLGTNNIPVPPTTCTGRLQFVERIADNNQKYKVLACVGSTNSSGSGGSSSGGESSGSGCTFTETLKSTASYCDPNSSYLPLLNACPESYGVGKSCQQGESCQEEKCDGIYELVEYTCVCP